MTSADLSDDYGELDEFDAILTGGGMNEMFPAPTPQLIDRRSLRPYLIETMDDRAFEFLAAHCVQIGEGWYIKLPDRGWKWENKETNVGAADGQVVDGCERDVGYCQIHLDAASAENFLTLIARHASRPMYWEVANPADLRDKEIDEPERWRVDALVNEDFDSDEMERRMLPTIFVFISIRFSRHHLAEVTEIVASSPSHLAPSPYRERNPPVERHSSPTGIKQREAAKSEGLGSPERVRTRNGSCWSCSVPCSIDEIPAAGNKLSGSFSHYPSQLGIGGAPENCCFWAGG